MKNLIRIFMAITIAAFLFTGCADDPCDSAVNCLNGTCIDGTCECLAGFEGKECEDKIDPCKNVTCDGAQVCIDGTCGCTDGFEGINCDVLAVGKFVGNWDAADSCPSAIEQPDSLWRYDVKINPLTNDQTKVEIFNFGGFGENFAWSTQVSGDTITIPLSAAGGFTVEGSGLMSEDRTTINWTYTVVDSEDNSEICEGVWLRL